MIATVEGVMMPPEGGYREIRKFAYTQQEVDTSHGGDLLKDANHAWEIVQRIVGGSIYAELPPPGNADAMAAKRQGGIRQLKFPAGAGMPPPVANGPCRVRARFLEMAGGGLFLW